MFLATKYVLAIDCSFAVYGNMLQNFILKGGIGLGNYFQSKINCNLPKILQSKYNAFLPKKC